MAKRRDIYSELGCEGFLLTLDEAAHRYPEYSDIDKLNADKVYFSGEHPTVLFVNVGAFDDMALRKIADIQHKAWNYRRVLLLMAVADTDIRVYNCHETPKFINKEKPIESQLDGIQLLKQDATQHDLGLLAKLFSRIGVDCGVLWTAEEAEISWSWRRHRSWVVDALVIYTVFRG